MRKGKKQILIIYLFVILAVLLKHFHQSIYEKQKGSVHYVQHQRS